MVSREQIAHILQEIALLLELKGENPFKVRAYRAGAEICESYSGDLLQKARDDELAEIKGIGDALARKIHELVATGKLGFHDKLRGEFPATIFELFEIPGLGPKKIKALHDACGVGSVADLKRVCESGEAASLSGFGKKTCEKILAAIAYRETTADRFRLGDVAPVVELIRERLRSNPAVTRVSEAGSVRRGKETVHDIDLLVATEEPGKVMEFFVTQDFVEDVVVHGKTKASVHLKNGLPCDLRAVSNAEYPFALNYFTGSKEHGVALRGRAREQGLTLNEYRLAPLDADNENAPCVPPINTEADLYAALGLSYIDPELRENTGEFEASDEHELPTLVQLENLRGTFHNHTTASDGKSTLTQMAEAARDLGLQYLGIADHSKSSVQAHGLDEKRLRAQIAEIEALNATFDGFRLFSGTECDIRKDGTLDFDDALLADLDYVVASVHNVFTLPEKEQTRRIIRAIENPNVTMLGHLTGRLLLSREPYLVDIPAIIDAAAETGTWIELNCNPRRLDMDWRWWRLARDTGVLCVINPDAHHVSGLEHLYFGVKIARKGWLRREDIANCYPLGRIEDLLRKKRLS